MAKKNELQSLIDEIDKVTGSDKTAELLAFLKSQSKIDQDNFYDIVASLKQLINDGIVSKNELKNIARQLKDIPAQFPKVPEVQSVEVKNQVEIPTEITVKNPIREIDIKSPAWLPKFMIGIVDTITHPLVKTITKAVSEVVLIGPTDPTKPIAVRLSDGRQFYTALNQIVQSGSTAGQDLQDIIDLLNQILSALGGAGAIVNTFGELSVVPATETVLASYTIPFGKSWQNRGVFGEGNGDGIFRVYKNVAKIWQNRIAWTDRGFDHGFEFDAVAGDVVELRIIHNRPVNHNFSGGFYGNQL